MTLKREQLLETLEHDIETGDTEALQRHLICLFVNIFHGRLGFEKDIDFLPRIQIEDNIRPDYGDERDALWLLGYDVEGE